MRRGFEVSKDDFGGQLRVSIAQEVGVHGGLGQDFEWSLELHAIPGMGDDTGRRSYDHA